ncbi:hypothetical protein M409DRAFT_55306 [Zasmidium cellare ATCC 36951]|uniref:Rhodopsin domain-containing protein n=1 Tax=Zasmidium cellare ATCC 36951 TaxID=1080233 RepID=A0A6A6CH19_ZASCE|nr:uncharacterized protein M409DRAFT_55306 [Zasmidium cellare ATCC 36951]KAF2165943.1 hypothetical protein M409DRAFT_55306 [Zasmidium cellare ATCC 36951]
MTAPNFTFDTPLGQSPPFATVTPTDHEAYIIIAAALGTSLTLMFGCIRVWVRWTGGSRYGFDDWLIAGTTALSFVQSTLVLIACHLGLGKSKTLLSSDALLSVQKLYYASNLLYIVCLAVSKASVTCFILRLTPIEPHTRFLKALLAALIIWAVAFVLLIATSCTASHPWLLLGQQCSGYLTYWAVFESLGCLYEVAMVGMSVWLVYSLQTSWNNRATVVIAFGARLLLIPIVALRLANYSKNGQHNDPTFLESEFVVWTSTELNYSIISATFPILRPLVNNFNTSWGGGDWSTIAYGTYVSSPQGSNDDSNRATGGYTIHEGFSQVATSIDESDEGDSLRSRRTGVSHEQLSGVGNDASNI